MNRQMSALRPLEFRPGFRIPRSPTPSEFEARSQAERAELLCWAAARRGWQKARCSARSVREAMPIRPTNPRRVQVERDLRIFAAAAAAVVQPQQSKLPPPEPAVPAAALRPRRLLPRQLTR